MRRKLIALMAATLAAVAMLPGTALAHAAVSDSNPKDKAKVTEVPSTVWVRFGGFFGPEQPFTLQDGSLQVFDACGNQVDAGDSSLNTTRDTISVSAQGKYRGKYTIKWSITALDGAEQTGKLSFVLAKGPKCPSGKGSK